MIYISIHRNGESVAVWWLLARFLTHVDEQPPWGIGLNSYHLYPHRPLDALSDCPAGCTANVRLSSPLSLGFATSRTLLQRIALNSMIHSFNANVCISLFLVGVIWSEIQAADPLAAARARLVDNDIIGAGIRNSRVIAAMQRTPRHRFVPSTQRNKAYLDMSLPIGGRQTISPPYIVAFMTEQLDPQPHEKVLEIGTGSGYQAAVLSGLVADVYSIEIVKELGRKAARTLRRLGYENVHTRIGDGYEGWPEQAPFDKIICTCSPERVPMPLVEQLAEGGLMIVPVGERFQQTLWRFTKVDGELRRENLQATFFVPMTGRAEEERQVKPDLTHPSLVNGSFEDTSSDSDMPRGWYYIRQGRVVDVSNAPAGSKALELSSTTAGLSAHVMQAIGVDGRRVREIEITYSMRGNRVRYGRSSTERPGILIEFYDAKRAPVGFERKGNWSGTFGWTNGQLRIRVPAQSRLAVIGVGLFGATGRAWFDEIAVRSTSMRKAE